MLARAILLSLLLAGGAPGAEPALRVATFRADATPAIGEPLIWVKPAAKIEDPLWAKGVLIDDGRSRYVLCAIDWCGIGGSTYAALRRGIAAAAGTDPSKVALQSVHQHTAPYIDGDGYRILTEYKLPPLRMSERYLETLAARIAGAVKEGAARMEPFDRLGTSEARVDRVASARRILRAGKLITRFSGSGKDPEMAAIEEGPVDGALRTITLARGAKPLARLHYYASHPQTFCCDGRVSGDFVNAARETLEKEEGVFQIYFTGCSGDVTAGKYNDGSIEARTALADRLREGMKRSIAATRFESARPPVWRTADLRLPGKEPGAAALRERLTKPQGLNEDQMYRTAIALAFAERREPAPASSLAFGNVRILHLPGEPMLEFQNYARQARPGAFVVVAGYGDMSPGYLCTDQAFKEGGYEPSASNGGPGTEQRVKEAISSLLGR